MHYPTLLTSVLTTLTLLHPTSASALPSHNSLQARQPDVNTLGLDFSKVTPFPFDEKDSAALENVFGAILNIPDDVIDKDDDGESLKGYFEKHHGAGLSIDVKTGNAISERQSWFHIAKCAFEIGKVILENGIPLAKLRRIKDLMKAVGSAKTIAKMLLKARSWAELVAIGGAPLAKLAQELAGLEGVVGACFSF